MDLAPELRSMGIDVHCLMPRHKWNLLGTARELGAIAKREQADVVHAHLYFPAVATALNRVLGISVMPTCVTFHNLAYSGANRPGIKLMFRRLVAGLLYRFGIDAFFAVSEAVARSYERKLLLPPIKIIPNPVDLTVVAKVVAQEVTMSRDLVIPGRIVPEKGHSDFLEALSRLAALGLHPAAVIAGDGPLRGQIEAQVQRIDFGEQVTFTGALEHEELLREMVSAAIVVVPSRFEGFGLVALEAMALGRSIIVSDVGGLPEVVGDAGILVPPANPRALAKAIAELISDPERRAELGNKAAKRAARFDLVGVAAQQISAYNDLLLSTERSENTKG